MHRALLCFASFAVVVSALTIYRPLSAHLSDSDATAKRNLQHFKPTWVARSPLNQTTAYHFFMESGYPSSTRPTLSALSSLSLESEAYRTNDEPQISGQAFITTTLTSTITVHATTTILILTQCSSTGCVSSGKMQPENAAITPGAAGTTSTQPTITLSMIASVGNSTGSLESDFVPPAQYKVIETSDHLVIDPSILTSTITLPLPITAPPVPTSSGEGVSATGMPNQEDTETPSTEPIESTYPKFWHHSGIPSTTVAASSPGSDSPINGTTAPVPEVTLSASSVELTEGPTAYTPYSYTRMPPTGLPITPSALLTSGAPPSSTINEAPTSAAVQTVMPAQTSPTRLETEADMVKTTIHLIDVATTVVTMPRNDSVAAWPYGTVTSQKGLPSESTLANQKVARATVDLASKTAQVNQGVGRAQDGGTNLACTLNISSNGYECSGAEAAIARAYMLGLRVILAWFAPLCWL
ncbi:hypothetical protein LTS18_006925 [Coniosporium uncinatum]|uniref:Uncharacterized protein n=1 Tax=Coniosporium uncinatum TaxID=93489 RepID=A0ACC3D343_9PEZI|nr:hypothetical protein LTS18_006925 [Coniosporium uncinatum]